jgi:hypothetical protein
MQTIVSALFNFSSIVIKKEDIGEVETWAHGPLTKEQQYSYEIALSLLQHDFIKNQEDALLILQQSFEKATIERKQTMEERAKELRALALQKKKEKKEEKHMYKKDDFVKVSAKDLQVGDIILLYPATPSDENNDVRTLLKVVGEGEDVTFTYIESEEHGDFSVTFSENETFYVLKEERHMDKEDLDAMSTEVLIVFAEQRYQYDEEHEIQHDILLTHADYLLFQKDFVFNYETLKYQKSN